MRDVLIVGAVLFAFINAFAGDTDKTVKESDVKKKSIEKPKESGESGKSSQTSMPITINAPDYGLDNVKIKKEDIDSEIRKNLSGIRKCYENELVKDTKLAGKIVVHFVISKTGDVELSEIKRSEMNNKNVEECIAKEMKKLKYPEPKGGGKVIVDYPFIFKNSEN